MYYVLCLRFASFICFNVKFFLDLLNRTFGIFVVFQLNHNSRFVHIVIRDKNYVCKTFSGREFSNKLIVLMSRLI